MPPQKPDKKSTDRRSPQHHAGSVPKAPLASIPFIDPPVGELRILSVRQPLASRIIDGSKPIENRSTSTPYRGTIWIHASRLDPKPTREVMEERVSSDCVDLGLAMWDGADRMPVGALIGCVELVEVVTADELWILAQTKLGAEKLDDAEARMLYPSQRDEFLERFRHVHELVLGIPEDARELHGIGPYCWLLREPRRLREPVAMKGKLGLWKAELPDSR